LHGEIFEFSSFFFCLTILFNLNGKATVCDTPLVALLLLCLAWLVVHDAEELKLSLLSTLQKQTNNTNSMDLHGFAKHEVQEELTKAGMTQTK
jgi:hypothetical protein